MQFHWSEDSCNLLIHQNQDVYKKILEEYINKTIHSGFPVSLCLGNQSVFCFLMVRTYLSRYPTISALLYLPCSLYSPHCQYCDHLHAVLSCKDYDGFLFKILKIRFDECSLSVQNIQFIQNSMFLNRLCTLVIKCMYLFGWLDCICHAFFLIIYYFWFFNSKFHSTYINTQFC